MFKVKMLQGGTGEEFYLTAEGRSHLCSGALASTVATRLLTAEDGRAVALDWDKERKSTQPTSQKNVA